MHLARRLNEVSRYPNVDVLVGGKRQRQGERDGDDCVFGGCELVNGGDCNQKVVYLPNGTRSQSRTGQREQG